MKNLLCLLLWLLLAVLDLCGQTATRTPAFIGSSKKVAAAGGGGETLAIWQATNSPTGDTAYVGIIGIYQNIATDFYATNSATVTRVEVQFVREGSPTFNVTASIYTNSATDYPGTLVGTGSDNVAATSIPTGTNWVSFTNISASIISGGRYWVVVATSAADAGNYLTWPNKLAPDASNLIANKNGANWENAYGFNYRWGLLKVYTQ